MVETRSGNKRVIVALAVLLATIAVTVAAASAGGVFGSSSFSGSRAAMADPAVVDVPAVGITFAPMPVAAGGVPVLPGRRAGVRQTQGIQAAVRGTVAVTAQGLLPNVQIYSQYGLFSDTMLAKRGASGVLAPVFRNRPVWLVTFSGPGLSMKPDITTALPGQSTATLAAWQQKMAASGGRHEDNVVIDAATGKFLEEYSCR